MALFNLLRKRPEAPIGEDVVNKPFMDVRGENVLSTPEEAAANTMVSNQKEPLIVVKQDSLGPYSEVVSKNPFKPDIPSVQDELEDIKIQLKSVTVQLANIIKTVDELERYVKREGY